MSYTIREIATVLKAPLVGGDNTRIDWLLTDSRSLCFPEESLFFALRTPRNGGHKFIPGLYARGVRNFVVSELPAESARWKDAGFLVVPSPLEALQQLSRFHREHFRIPVVGITGSNGKTIVKEWLAALLTPSMRVTRSPRSYNSQIGVPLSLWQLDATTQVGIFEAGISEPGEMKRLVPLIQPTVGIFTYLGAAHQEGFSSLEDKCMEKLLLMKECHTVIYAAGNPLLDQCIAQSKIPAERLMAWSRTDPHARVYIPSVLQSEEWTTIDYVTGGQLHTFSIPFADDASVENSIHCLCAAWEMGLTPDEIAARMTLLEPVAMRLEVKEGRNQCIVINDSYNSDLSSLDIALDFLYRRSEAKGMCRTLILSDLPQMGEPPALLYPKVSRLLQNRGINKVIAIGAEVRAITLPDTHFFTTTEEFLGSTLLHSLRDEIILLKGSRAFRFERISEALSLKVHETILEVDLNALAANFNGFRSRLRPETKIVCMVKASAYGAGSREVAKTLQELRTDYLAVSVADEGSALRNAGITTGIMVMTPEMSGLSTLFEYELEPEVYSFRLLRALVQAAQAQGITHYPIHLKIDTGMHRMGFVEEEIPLLMEELRGQKALLPRSVFSHLAGSDSADLDAFTVSQVRQFERAAGQLQKMYGHKILRHILNSAGIERFPEYQMDMVRLGIGLYGVSAVNDRNLRPVSALRTTVLQIRDVPAGDTVGYSRKGIVSRPSRIADLPIGYADGVNRRLSNGKGGCMVRGKYAPFIGNICMDVAMIDVTDIPDCQEGDRVEIFGPQQPVSVLAGVLDTIPYEVLTGISDRVKRIYFQES